MFPKVANIVGVGANCVKMIKKIEKSPGNCEKSRENQQRSLTKRAKANINSL